MAGSGAKAGALRRAVKGLFVGLVVRQKGRGGLCDIKIAGRVSHFLLCIAGI